MTEFVYRPLRVRAGNRVQARLFSGRYALTRAGKVFTVALHTPDIKVARKRLRDLVVAKQSEAEGIVAPTAQREAAAASLAALVAEYRADLSGRGFSPAHIVETIGRITRMFSAADWQRLSDIRPDAFVAWRARLSFSEKTKKEYQTSVNAFLNWLVRMERLAINPLARVGRVDIRGKAVRKSRAFTVAEMASLLGVSPPARRMVTSF